MRLVLCLLLFAITVNGTVSYPLKQSANHRYFIDQNNVPFLVVGDSPQSLIVKLNSTDQTTYFADRQSKGFNAVLIDVLCATYTGGGTDGTAAGIKPFTTGTDPASYDLATPNETYFALVDAALSRAAAVGIVVFLDPIETGSWTTTLANNGSTKATNYGAFLGNRYKNTTNIVWFHGNDFSDGCCPLNSTNNNLVGNVIDGIQSVDTNHLHTILLGRTDFATNSDVYSNLDTVLSSKFGANAAYTFSSTVNVTLNAYNSTPTTPVFLGEANYEFENILGYAGGATGTRRLRAENYGALTFGSIGGILYGNTFTTLSTWPSDQAARLDTPGAAEIAHINTLFNQIAWWNLVPDQTHAVVTVGYGSVPGNNVDPALQNYCTTSASAAAAVTYCPANTTITVALSGFSGAVTARKYDPSNGTFSAVSGSPFANSGTHDFVLTGNNADGNPDWVLLLQSNAQNAISGVTKVSGTGLIR